MPGNLCIFTGFLYLWYASKQSVIVIIFGLLVYMRQKNKETYGFILVATGLLIGFFLGAGIVYWFSNHPKDSFISEKTRDQLSGLFPDDDEQTKNTKNSTEMLDPSPVNNTHSLPFESEMPTVDSIPADQTSVETSRIDHDSADVPPLETNKHDSLFVVDTLTITNMHTEMEEITPSSVSTANAINIKKERLIGIRGFYLPSHNHDDQNQSFETLTLDSLLGGTRQSEQDNKTFYIEFWESPLNYTRYRMTKNRIVVFGLNQADFVSLKEINNTLFLKYYEDYFPIESTLDFKPLIPFNDSLLINKLEQQWP